MVMHLKKNLNHKEYIKILRKMTPEQRLSKALELSETARSLFRAGLRQGFPELSDDEFHRLYLERLELCHNRNY